MRSNFTGTCYNPEFEGKKADLKEGQLKKLQTFEKFLEGRNFLGGENEKYVDFVFFETMDHHRTMFPDIFDKMPNLKQYMDRFESLEKVSCYRKSDRFSKYPINNVMAKWGFKPDN